MNSVLQADSTGQPEAKVPTLLPMVELERRFTSVQQQIEQLQQRRAQLVETDKSLENELAAPRESLKQLQEDRDKYKEVARMYLDMGDSLENAIRDFETMPPLDQLTSADDVLAELETLQKSLREKKSA